ncbi:glycosyltransferase, partial [Pelagibacteraceae bacterium]|nr:glycosyltransferase [Pelagibacteraceae bacterium]
MKKKPLVSIIINCLNGEKYLSKAIISVLNQKYKNWEIIFF